MATSIKSHAKGQKTQGDAHNCGYCASFYIVTNVLLCTVYRPREVFLLIMFMSSIFEGFLHISKVFVKEDEGVVLVGLKLRQRMDVLHCWHYKRMVNGI